MQILGVFTSDACIPNSMCGCLDDFWSFQQPITQQERWDISWSNPTKKMRIGHASITPGTPHLYCLLLPCFNVLKLVSSFRISVALNLACVVIKLNFFSNIIETELSVRPLYAQIFKSYSNPYSFNFILFVPNVTIIPIFYQFNDDII